MNDKVSIIVPVYNMEDYLEECISSVVKQTYKNIELLLIDDGSKDGSYEKACELSKKNKFVIAIHQENQGSGPARNNGIKNATGKYVLFIDADDFLENDAVEKLVNVAKNENSDLIVFGYKKITDDGKTNVKSYQSRKCVGKDIREHYEYYFDQLGKWGIQGAPWNKFFDLEIIKHNEIEYPSLKRHQDEVFISRYVSYAENVVFITDVLYNHRVNSKKKVYAKFPLDYISIVKELYHYRKTIIGKWNPHNEIVKELMYSEYINNVLKSCCLILNPKLKLKRSKRIQWYSEKMNDVEFENLSFPKKYIGSAKFYSNKMFVFLVSHRLYRLLDYFIMLRNRF